MTEEDIVGEAIEKGKSHVIREICKLDRSKTQEELKKIVFTELVKMKKELKAKPQKPDFMGIGAYSFSSLNGQEDV
jgi:hypothetical protein